MIPSSFAAAEFDSFMKTCHDSHRATLNRAQCEDGAFDTMTIRFKNVDAENWQEAQMTVPIE